MSTTEHDDVMWVVSTRDDLFGPFLSRDDADRFRDTFRWRGKWARVRSLISPIETTQGGAA